MARVHCPDCEMAVVVDPLGICPEGHRVGADAGRIEAAIGDATPHPDEPEPWSAVVEALEVDDEADAPREIRPISMESMEAGAAPEASPAPTGSADANVPDPMDSDDVLRELHALSGFDTPADDTSGPPPPEPSSNNASPAPPSTQAPHPRDVPPPPVAGWPSPNVPNAAPPPPDLDASEAVGGPPPPTRRRAPAARTEESLDAIAELSALFDDLDDARSAQDTPPPPPTGTAPQSATGERLATVSHLPVKHLPDEPAPHQDRETAPDDSGFATASQGSGEGGDWSHFTARGKKRRFGR